VEKFIKQLEIILKFIYKPKSEIILCGDFNVNFLENSDKVHQVISLLQTYNLFRVVDFPTRITKNSSTAIDNIFLDYCRLNTYQVFSVFSGLSDHDAQYLIVNNGFSGQRNTNGLVKRRVMTKHSISTFTDMLQSEIWDNIYSNADVNVSFN
jgi:hypothetical protein